MTRPENSFAIMPDLASQMPRISQRFRWYWRIAYRLRALWRLLRVSRPMTLALGPQYTRSRDLIEIDITYACNLHCHNCNRSVSQARETMHMPVAMITRFVNESIEREQQWRRIRVLGGEPTLHPEFHAIVSELRRYQAWHSPCIVEVVTNGYGEEVMSVLEELPKDVFVDNTRKSGPVQPHFGPFNLAPIDEAQHCLTDFSNACVIARDCGMGLTPLGYYPCAVAGGIDRILGAGLGRDELPSDDDDMLREAAALCGLCGRFKDGHFVPRSLRPHLDRPEVSKSWLALYLQWKNAKRNGVEPVPITLRGQLVADLTPGEYGRDPTQTT